MSYSPRNPRKAEAGGVPPSGNIPLEWLHRTKVMIVWDDMLFLVLAWRIARWASALVCPAWARTCYQGDNRK